VRIADRVLANADRPHHMPARKRKWQSMRKSLARAEEGGNICRVADISE